LNIEDYSMLISDYVALSPYIPFVELAKISAPFPLIAKLFSK